MWQAISNTIGCGVNNPVVFYDEKRHCKLRGEFVHHCEIGQFDVQGKPVGAGDGKRLSITPTHWHTIPTKALHATQVPVNAVALVRHAYAHTWGFGVKRRIETNGLGGEKVTTEQVITEEGVRRLNEFDAWVNFSQMQAEPLEEAAANTPVTVEPIPEITGVWTPYCVELPAESGRIILLYSVDSHEFMTLSQFEAAGSYGGAGRFRPSHWMRLKEAHVCIDGPMPNGKPVIAYLPEYGYRVGTSLGIGLLATAHATIGMVERWGELPDLPAAGAPSTQQVHHTKPTASTGQILAFVKGKWRSVFAAEFERISGFIGGATAWMPVPRLGVWRAGCGMVPKGKRVIGVYGPDRGCRAYVGAWDGRYFTHEDTFNGPAICQAPIYWEPFPVEGITYYIDQWVLRRTTG